MLKNQLVRSTEQGIYCLLITQVLSGLKGAQLSHVGYEYFSEIAIPFPLSSEQEQIVQQLKHEQRLVVANKELITPYGQMIKTEIAQLWHEDKVKTT